MAVFGSVATLSAMSWYTAACNERSVLLFGSSFLQAESAYEDQLGHLWLCREAYISSVDPSAIVQRTVESRSGNIDSSLSWYRSASTCPKSVDF